MEKKEINRREFLKYSAALGGAALINGIGYTYVQAQRPKVWKIVYEHYLPEGTTETGHHDQWFFSEVEKKSSGRIKMEWYWASALHKTGEHLQATRDGLIDATIVSYGYVPALVPLSRGLEFYFVMNRADAFLKMCRELYKFSSPLRQEWEVRNKVKVLLWTNWGYCPLFMKKPVSKVEDLKGLKIRGYGVGADTMNRLGGTGMAVIAPEVYTSLERGILDGVFAYAFYSAKGARLHEQAPYVIEIGAGPHAPSCTVINKPLWDSFPEDLKAVFNEVIDEWYRYKYVELYTQLFVEAVDKMVADGAKFRTWSPTEIAKARKIVQPAQLNTWIETVAKPQGFDGKEFVGRMLALAKKYDPEGKLKTPWEIYQERYRKK